MNRGATFFVSLAVIVLIGCVDAQQKTFQANVKIYNDPSVSGILNGYMYYDGTGLKLRTDYTVGTQEIIQYNDKLKYLKCSSDCDTTTYTDPWPVFYKLSTDAGGSSTTTINGRSCTYYSRVSTAQVNEVMYLWVASSGTGAVCRVQFKEADGNAGTIIDFTNNAALASSSVFSAYTSWNCPQQTCVQKFDMFLVFDESGSIKNTPFQTEKNFAISIAQAYTFGSSTGVGMGLVMFDDDARLITSLDYNQQSFINAVNGVTQGKGNTCIGCGINLAQQYLDSPYDRSEVSDIMVVLTDGANNVGNYLTAANNAKNKGTIIFVIGVGSDIDYDQLEAIASDPDYVFLASSFSTTAFDQVLDQLIAVTCLPIYGNPCGSGCKGYCSCNQVCLCPDQCDDGNACTDDKCSTSSNGAGCYYPTKTCDDGNACTVNKCFSATGCDFNTAVVCNDNNACTNNTCDPTAGCKYPAINCEDGNPCTLNTCNTGSGCQSTSQNCNKCQFGPTGIEGPTVCANITCMNNLCNPSTGLCEQTPKSCDDNNKCTTEVCSNDQCVYTNVDCDDGDECTVDTCAAATGCVHTPIDAATECNDYNVCTEDTCDSKLGCVNLVFACPSDGDLCTTDICNSVTGCSYVPRDCAQEPDIAAYLGDCYEAECTNDNSTGCYLKQVDGTNVDDCGYCKGSGNVCILGLDTEQAAAVGGGILAAIIIGSVALCAALGAFSSKVGYDMWMKHRNTMTGANSNPLYTSNGMEGNNPFYRDSTPL